MGLFLCLNWNFNYQSLVLFPSRIQFLQVVDALYPPMDETKKKSLLDTKNIYISVEREVNLNIYTWIILLDFPILTHFCDRFNRHDQLLNVIHLWRPSSIYNGFWTNFKPSSTMEKSSTRSKPIFQFSHTPFSQSKIQPELNPIRSTWNPIRQCSTLIKNRISIDQRGREFSLKLNDSISEFFLFSFFLLTLDRAVRIDI